MKKNIISSASPNGNNISNLLNPQMLQLFSQLLANKNNNSANMPQKNAENPLAEEKKLKQTELRENSEAAEINLIYNKQLAALIKKHDKIIQRLNKLKT